MSYRYKTQFYRIPVMGEGDMLTEEQEWVQMSTIDNLLYAASFGCRNAYMEEGDYSLEWNEGHSECHLHVRPFSAGGYSLLGMINGRMFKSMVDVSVGTLYGNATYYVYVEYESGLETDSQCFSVRAYTSRQEEGDFRMCLCIVDTHGGGSVNTDVNKVYAKSILAHTMDSTNPHGKSLVQDRIEVNDSLTLKGKGIRASAYKSAITGGPDMPVEIAFDSVPLFIEVYPEEFGAGEIAWKISGKKATIFNSGKRGIRINVKADME